MSSMRPLILHASALNDEEYDLFTSSITDLVAPDPPPADDAHFEQVSISIREARAWLRGRYPDLPVADLDQILRYFAPGPAQDSALTGGQFFAILRLVLHARNGAELERNLVFVQVHPEKPPKTSPVRAAQAHDAPISRSAPPSRPRQGSTDAPSPDTNPFHHLNEEQPPTHPDRRASMTSFHVVDSSAAPAHHPSNPFLVRSKTIHSTPPHADATASPRPTPAAPAERKLPPLPPRKPPPLLPPRGASLLLSAPHVAPPPPHSKPPAPPPPPKVPHLTSTLMKQSLQASKDAQNAKRMEAEREQARVLQVLRKSGAARERSTSPLKPGASSRATSSAASLASSDGRTTPALPPRRRASPPPPSPSPSARSFEQVASAAIAGEPRRRRPHSSPARSPSPSRPSMDLPPPPRHPDRALAESAPPSPRVVRSKSMHHPPPPPPPAARRRPESVQLPPSPLPSSPFPPLARHMSLSAARETGPALAQLQKTLSAARDMAGAGLARRGYVPHAWRGERLVGEEGLGVDEEDADADADVDVDGEGCAREDRDGMKWPAGDGWRPL